MKADILRRAEAISDSDSDEEEAIFSPAVHRGAGKGRTVAFEEELDDDGVDGGGGGASLAVAGRVKVLGDGEESGGDEDEEDENEEEGDGEEGKQTPETILELAYIRDPGLFDRDAQTRRGKGRVELRGLTGTGILFLKMEWFLEK
jgi:activating signal cointegrator complex subunit 2